MKVVEVLIHYELKSQFGMTREGTLGQNQCPDILAQAKKRCDVGIQELVS